MKVLVTGGAGFIGSHIVDQCIAQGHQVVVIDNLSTGSQQYVHKAATFYSIDITDAKLAEVFVNERPQIVFHQAAQTRVQTSVEQPVYDANINIIGTINLLESARKVGVKKMIIASSAAVYGNPVYLPIDEQHPVDPLSGYGAGKYTTEQYLRIYKNLYGMEYTALRYANVYGVRQDPQGEGGVISVFIDRILQDDPLTIFGDGEQTRDYINVSDVARANIAAIEKGNGAILNVGTGVNTSINQLVQLFETIAGKSIHKVRETERAGDIKYSYFDSTKAQQVLDWQAEVDLAEGLKQTFRYYQNRYKSIQTAPR